MSRITVHTRRPRHQRTRDHEPHHSPRHTTTTTTTTQTVFGEGRRSSALMLIGDQPDEKEDGQRHECVLDAGISRDDVYATNAVKHFKHEVRGKRRLIRHALVDVLRLAREWAVR